MEYREIFHDIQEWNRALIAHSFSIKTGISRQIGEGAGAGSSLGARGFAVASGQSLPDRRLPFDATLAAQEFPPPRSTITLHQAASALGFRTGEKRVTAAVLPGLTIRGLDFLSPLPVTE